MINPSFHVSGFFTAAYLRQAFPILPKGCKWHTLRSLFLQYVNHCYKHPMAINYLGRLVLVHFQEADSLCYVSTRVDGIDDLKHAFGRLRI